VSTLSLPTERVSSGGIRSLVESSVLQCSRSVGGLKTGAQVSTLLPDGLLAVFSW